MAIKDAIFFTVWDTGTEAIVVLDSTHGHGHGQYDVINNALPSDVHILTPSICDYVTWQRHLNRYDWINNLEIERLCCIIQAGPI